MAKCHADQYKDVAIHQGKVFSDSTKWLVLLYEASLQAKLRPQTEPTAVRKEDAVVVFEFNRTYNERPLRKYPRGLRPHHPMNASSSGKRNRRPRASHR